MLVGSGVPFKFVFYEEGVEELIRGCIGLLRMGFLHGSIVFFFCGLLPFFF